MKKYVCPHCGNDTFEEVTVDVTVTFRIINTENGLEYSEQKSAEGGYVSRIQCESCGHVIEAEDGYPADMLDDLPNYLNVIETENAHE